MASSKEITDLYDVLNGVINDIHTVDEKVDDLRVKMYPGSWKIFVPICSAIMMLGLGLAFGSTGDWFSGFLWSAAATSTTFATIVGFQR